MFHPERDGLSRWWQLHGTGHAGFADHLDRFRQLEWLAFQSAADPIGIGSDAKGLRVEQTPRFRVEQMRMRAWKKAKRKPLIHIEPRARINRPLRIRAL